MGCAGPDEHKTPWGITTRACPRCGHMVTMAFPIGVPDLFFCSVCDMYIPVHGDEHKANTKFYYKEGHA